MILTCPVCHETNQSSPFLKNWRKNGIIKRAGKKQVQRYQCQHCGYNTTIPVMTEAIVAHGL